MLIRAEETEKLLNLPDLKRRGKLAAEIQSQHWQCKFCGKAMTPKVGPIRIWHFAHKQSASDCPFRTESDSESTHHLLLKRTSGEALSKYFGNQFASLEYEVRVPEARRIADVMITLKDDSRIAVEAQLSPITLEHLQERTHAYLNSGIEVVWVFLEENLKSEGLWSMLRQWLLEQGCLVLSARSVFEETALILGN